MPKYDEIIHIFIQLQEASENVKLLNVYKGLPLSYEATVQEVNAGIVTFKLNRYQATCLELQRLTFIQSPELHQVARGSVVAVDFLNETAVLTNFVYMGGDIGKRLLVRVQPKDPIQVDLAFKGTNLHGQLSDLSISGVGVITGTFLVRQNFFAVNSSIVVSLKLPVSNTPIKLVGRIANTRKDQNSYRLGIYTSPDTATKTLLTQYISQRQAEVQRELRMMSETFLRLANGEDQTT